MLEACNLLGEVVLGVVEFQGHAKVLSCFLEGSGIGSTPPALRAGLQEANNQIIIGAVGCAACGHIICGLVNNIVGRFIYDIIGGFIHRFICGVCRLAGDQKHGHQRNQKRQFE